MKNPFNYTFPLRGLEGYIGRSNLQVRIRSLLESYPSISISGPRRMGTTSTLNWIQAVAQENGYETVYIDLRKINKSGDERTYIDGIAEALGTDGHNIDVKSTSSVRRAKPLLLAIDEFDISMGLDTDQILEFLDVEIPYLLFGNAFFRTNSPEQDLYRLVLGSRQLLAEIENAHAIQMSPRFYDFVSLRLRPLNREEAWLLVSEPSYKTERSLVPDANWIVDYVGTWPFFIKLACHHAFDAKNVGPAYQFERKEQELLEGLIWEDALPYLDSQWLLLSQRQRDLLADLVNGKSIKDLGVDRDFLSLVNDGYCSISDGIPEVASILFRQFFVSKTIDLGDGNLPSIDTVMDNIVLSLGRMGTSASELSSWDDGSEKAIQEVAYLILRSQYQRVAREVHVGRGPVREYRADILLEDHGVLIEIKRVRNSDHARRLQAEINDDLIGYREAEWERKIVFLIWDRERHVTDREYFSETYERVDRNTRIVFAP